MTHRYLHESTRLLSKENFVLFFTFVSTYGNSVIEGLYFASWSFRLFLADLVLPIGYAPIESKIGGKDFNLLSVYTAERL